MQIINNHKFSDLNNRLAKSVVEMPPSGIREFFDLVAQREDIVTLGVGEPDFVTPQSIIDNAIESLRNGFTYYSGNQGFLSLREAIAQYLEELYQVKYNPKDEIIVTVGVSEAVDLALRAAINPGDGVLYGSPGYVSYSPLIRVAGGVAQKISTSADKAFKMDYSAMNLAVDEKSKILFLNYPSNPTGASYTKEELLNIASFVQEKNLIVISDEIYSELSYNDNHIPFSAIDGMKERTVLMGGFSKGFAMTGWRIGYAAGPKEWIYAMLKIHQYSMLCAPTIAQFGAEAALKYARADALKMRESYKSRRDFIVKAFNEIGLKTINPEGAFYIFPDIKSTGLDSYTFAKKLLNDESVAVIPGSAFGSEGEGFIRCCYATKMEDLQISVERIRRFISRL